MIPLFRPSCTDLEIKYVTETLRSGWWDQGPRVEELEGKFAERTGTRHAIAMNSATMALQLTVQALGISGGEIIMPALTFPSTGLAALHNGCSIVFADIDWDTLCLDWNDVSRKFKVGRTAAVIPVWYGGTVVPPSLHGNWMLIEDCAHAAGSAIAGTLGDAACWSFQTKKNIASGDGGMVTTDDDALAERLRRLRWCGISRSTYDRDKSQGYSWEYDIPEAGWKAHMNDITAALALAQLERLDEMNASRRKIVRRYLDELSDVSLRLPSWDEYSAWHLFPVRLYDDYRRDDFIDHMKSRGVTTGVHYKPLNTYEVFGRQPLPVTDHVWRTLVTLPLYPDMTEEDITQVISAVRSFR